MNSKECRVVCKQSKMVCRETSERPCITHFSQLQLYQKWDSVAKANSADADDTVQDVFIKYYSLNKEFDDEAHLKAWLIRVTINRAKDIRSSFWRKHRETLEEYMETLMFEEPEDGRLFEEVMELPEKYRIAIHLYYYEEYSVREIEDILKRRESTVKSQLSRGRMLLKEMLKEEWDNEE